MSLVTEAAIKPFPSGEWWYWNEMERGRVSSALNVAAGTDEADDSQCYNSCCISVDGREAWDDATLIRLGGMWRRVPDYMGHTL